MNCTIPITYLLLTMHMFRLLIQLMMKEAKTGGGFVWHQDYGYWYQNGCLFPEMATVFIPVDRYNSL